VGSEKLWQQKRKNLLDYSVRFVKELIILLINQKVLRRN